MTKRGRISIYVDGVFTCTLHPDIWALSGLSTGSRVSSQQLEEVYRQSQDKLAREKALRLLSQRSYTAKCLRDKLARVSDEESAEGAVARMEELGLVDDADYARRYAADCLHLKGYALRRTGQALRDKGIDAGTIRQVLSELEFDGEASAARILKRRYLGGLEEEKGRIRAVNALMRLGYEYSDIRAAIENLLEDADYYEELNTRE